MIKLMSLLTEWSSKRDPNKVDLKWIRHIQISTAEPDVIGHHHIAKTTKAMLKVDKKLGSQFKKMGDKYIKHREKLTKDYDKMYKGGAGDVKKASAFFEKGMKIYAKMGKELIDFTEKNFNAVK